MKIAYDVEYLPQRKYQCRDSEEVAAIKVFLAGTQKNMVITYEDAQQAKRRYDCIRSYRKNNKLDDVFECYRADCQVCIVRGKKKGRPAKGKETILC